jgi:hypothetical protein
MTNGMKQDDEGPVYPTPEWVTGLTPEWITGQTPEWDPPPQVGKWEKVVPPDAIVRWVEPDTATITTDSKARKATPVYSGFLNYFPEAVAAVAQLSFDGNEKHNPGEPLHWSHDKSNDHKDCIARHLLELGAYDPDDRYLHDVKLAWRALANLTTVLRSGKKAKL